jgi:hypothetical protein
MPGKIYRYLADDHVRLEGLLERATARPDSIDPEPYPAFRAGLLKHIAMEEKILNPIEEGPDGLYAQCEQLAGAESNRILTQLQAARRCSRRHGGLWSKLVIP